MGPPCCIRCRASPSLTCLLPCSHVVVVCWTCGISNCPVCKQSGRCPFTDAAVAVCGSDPNITCIAACGVSDRQAEAIVNSCPQNCQAFDFWKSGISDSMLEVLFNRCGASITHLNLRGCAAVTDAGIAHLARCANLERVYLKGLPKVTEKAMQHVLATSSTVKFCE